MNGFEKRALRIKQNILQTTIRLLSISELKHLRIADIAKAAGVSQVTIYNYFGSKEALLREAFIDYMDKEIREFENKIYESESFRKKIEYILLRKKGAFRELKPATFKELMAGDPELHRYIDGMYREKTIPLMVRIVEDGKRSGEISETVSVESVLALIQLFMNQYEAILEMAHNSGDTDRFLHGFVHLFFYGICGIPNEGSE